MHHAIASSLSSTDVRGLFHSYCHCQSCSSFFSLLVGKQVERKTTGVAVACVVALLGADKIVQDARRLRLSRSANLRFVSSTIPAIL